MLKKDHFYFKSWIFLVSSESFINKRMSLALTSWAHICRRTCFSSATGYSRNEKSDLLLKRKKNKSLPSALLWSITWRETYLDMFSGQWLHLAAKKNLLGGCLLKHEISDGCCDVFLVLCTKLALILHRKWDVRRIWALTPRICSSWRAAWPYAVYAREQDLSGQVSHCLGFPPAR